MDRDLLIGRWVHSHEEDAPGRQVFRPAEAPLPPSRGRLILELRADGALVESAPGAADVPREETGSWRLSGSRLTLRSPASGERTLEVASVERDKLVVMV